MKNGGRVARTAGLVITTAIAAAACQATNWEPANRFFMMAVTIVIGALLAAMAADFDGPEQ